MAKSEPELYKPAEACKMAEVAPYVLRYWETEFPVLAERKEKGGNLYSAREVRIIARIRELLYDEGFTVAGARKRLESELSEGRFDAGLAAAPPPAEQKRSAKIAGAVERSQPHFLPQRKGALPVSAPAPAVRSAAPEPTKPSSPRDFPERRRVLQELKEIARLLDRPHPR